ncbi:MAG: deoxyribodipyrimidine photolyase [Pseudomonadota bacterium]
MLAPDLRLKALNKAPINSRGGYVVYWMTAARRTSYNFGLEHAAARASKLGKGLVVLEALRCDYPYASPRLHAFIVQGMADNAQALRQRPVLYHPYLEPEPGAGKGLLAAWAEKACAVVCDWYPCFFIPRMLKAAASEVGVRVEAVDSCGLAPLDAPGNAFARAYDFRRWLQKSLSRFLNEMPAPDPLAVKLPRPPAMPRRIAQAWPAAVNQDLILGKAISKVKLPPGPGPVDILGGAQTARKALRRFLKVGLQSYAEKRNQPEDGFTSGLSPYMHFGHISAHEIFYELAEAEAWAPHLLSLESKGKREGWWGMSASAEAFLDQLITWRELGYNFCQYRADYDRYESLPEWALSTLKVHAGDKREYQYSLDELKAAATHDEIWNAAQRQLLRQGVIAGYLRMLWGKKILEWSPSPRTARARMIELNDRYALDGRDPNSYSGIFWCLGRYDRPFGPERPVFGKVRFMSSQSTRRKLRLTDYLERFGPGN